MIEFGVWAPSEAVFWQSWVDAGICSQAGVFKPGYAGFISMSDQTTQGWVPTKDDVPVPGWHANVKVFGALEAQMRYGIDPLWEDGTPKDVWHATWASDIFSLQEQDADPVTGFPAGMRNSVGVTYADASAFKSPTNVLA